MQPPARSRAQLSADEARRIALAAQGFDRPRPGGRIDARHFRRVIDTVGLLQIDSVNVLARAHYMPLFSRLGAYDLAAFDRYAWGSGRMFEYWGHEASLIPVERYGLFRHRMDGAFPRAARNQQRLRGREETVARVLREIGERGPVVVGDVHEGERRGGWWEWGDAKVVLEALYTTGRLAITDRRNFARLYDLPERALPAEVLDGPHPDEADAQRELMRLAARHHGIGTAADLADYYRLGVGPAKRRLEELADAGEVERVQVAGWPASAYLAPDARLPRRIEARALLSPFDPVTWNRDRAHRLFDFHYRIEIYTPAEKRQYGYYVLPFLLGDDLVARVDLKADRQAGQLLVQAAHLESGREANLVASELADELREVASWLGLREIVVARRGDLATALDRATRNEVGL